VRSEGRLARVALASLAAAAVTGRAGAADVEPSHALPVRDFATLASRETVIGAQAAAAREAVRWRLRALRGLAAERFTLDGTTFARAVDAEGRALARELAEARSLAAERDRARADGAALAVASRAVEAIGPPPALVLPVTGAVVARFGVATDHATGLLLPRAGVRLAATNGASVRAPFAGRVALVAAEPEGPAVAIEDGAGWTAIVSGLAGASVVEGQELSAGERLGTAAGTLQAPAAVGFEVWRGRRPVDPLLLAGAPAARATLAAPPRLP
jgi:septal ring factor EnvC (AmiA/AmiB activator)